MAKKTRSKLATITRRTFLVAIPSNYWRSSIWLLEIQTTLWQPIRR